MQSKVSIRASQSVSNHLSLGRFPAQGSINLVRGLEMVFLDVVKYFNVFLKACVALTL